MIDFTKPNILTDNLKEIQEISFDSANNFSMNSSNYMAVDFDDVKDNYFFTNSFYSTSVYRSNDAFVLFDTSNEKFIFIEFKNGDVTKKIELEKIRTKISESLLIINDLFNTNLTYDRDHINYILVYNQSKNPSFERQRNSSLTAIATVIAHSARTNYLINGFDKYKAFFHNVQTINETEFSTIMTSIEDSSYSF